MFTSNEVKSQLVAQKIVFPPAGRPAITALPKADAAGPTSAKLAAQVETVFKGTTLRGMLLNACGFWQMGQIAWCGAIAAFAGAALLLILSPLEVAHLRRAPETAEAFPIVSHAVRVQTA